MSPGVKPGETAPQFLHLQPPERQKLLVHRGYLQLAPGRRLDPMGDLHNLVRVEVQPCDRIVALRLQRLLLDAEAVAFAVELRHPVALRIADLVPEHGRLPIRLRRPHSLLQLPSEPASLEDVVSQHEARAILTDEVLPDDERLRQPIRRRLLSIFKTDSEVLSVPQKPLESRQVRRRGDDEYVPDPRHHQHRDRIVNHRLVINRKHLLANPLGNRIEARPASPGQNYSFHIQVVLKV